MSAEAVLPDRPAMAAASSNLPGRQARARVVSVLLLLGTLVGLLALVILLVTVFGRGWSWITPEFFTRAPSRLPERSGIAPALLGTIWVVTVTALVGFPLGLAAAIYLEEYAPRNWWTRVLNVNISNLAGVPSVVYGLLGLGIFVEWMRFGRSILSGALALALLMLPIVIIASREALRAVPPSLREAAYGVGATKWQVVRHHVLPAAAPGILTGTILALATAVGETAPLLVTGAVAYITYNPSSILDRYTVLPVQIFNWSSRPQDEFRELAAAAIIVLLGVLLILSATAVILRQRVSRKAKW